MKVAKKVAMRANAKAEKTVAVKVAKTVEKQAVWKEGLLKEEREKRGGKGGVEYKQGGIGIIKRFTSWIDYSQNESKL